MSKKHRKKALAQAKAPATHWQASLRDILREHNSVSACKAKVVSYATQAARRQILWQGFKQLRHLGYRLNDVHHFKAKHLKALAHHWEAQGLSAARLQNNISIFRTFSKWIGKAGMIGTSVQYVRQAGSVTRRTKTTVDKTWTGQGVNVQQTLQEVVGLDERVAMVLKLQAAFALRMKEASLLRVHQADRQHYLLVNWGTKGGRDRVVPIEQAWQRQLLKEAQALVKRKTDSLIPRDKNFKQWQAHFYYVCQKAGLSRKQGLTSHGLRHERLNQIYETITGQVSPIKGQRKGTVPRAVDALARQEVVEVAGHSRNRIAKAYLG